MPSEYKTGPCCTIVARAYRGTTQAGKEPLPPSWKAPRRLSVLCRALINCAAEVLKHSETDVTTLPVVFASRYAELYRTMGLLQEWRDYGDFSPAGFALSVHNAPASMLSQIMADHAAFTTIAAGEDSLRMGLLDAGLMAGQKGACLFLYADAVQPMEEPCQACALLLQAGGRPLDLPSDLKELFPELT